MDDGDGVPFSSQYSCLFRQTWRKRASDENKYAPLGAQIVESFLTIKNLYELLWEIRCNPRNKVQELSPFPPISPLDSGENDFSRRDFPLGEILDLEPEEEPFRAVPTVPSLVDEIKELQKQPAAYFNSPALVFMQSCSSVDNYEEMKAIKAGAIAYVGSTCSVYSASGAAFTKVFFDAIIYDNKSVGEALIYAQNYFRCLAKLKRQKGHNEVAKVFRAALSFSLIGDPTLHFVPSGYFSPIYQVIDPQLDGNKITLEIPTIWASRIDTEKYYITFPYKAEFAGILKRKRNHKEFSTTKDIDPTAATKVLVEQSDATTPTEVQKRRVSRYYFGAFDLGKEGEIHPCPTFFKGGETGGFIESDLVEAYSTLWDNENRFLFILLDLPKQHRGKQVSFTIYQ